MNYFGRFYKENLVFVFLITFIIIGYIFYFIFGHSQSFLIINDYHNSFGDFFFKYITHLGDGIIFPVLIIIIMFLKLRWSLYFLLASFLTLLFMYITKQLLFHGVLRPTAFFENLENLYLVNDIEIHRSNSFPSGHTTTAFAIFTLLILITKNNYLKFTFASLAIIVAHSRVYLSQHFLIDVLIGATFGLIIALVSRLLIDKICYKNKICDESITVIFSNKKIDHD